MVGAVRVATPFAVVLLTLSLTVPATAGGSVVMVTDSTFVEDVSNLPRPGYAVPWEWADDVNLSHNVRQDVGLFRSGDPTSDTSATYERVFSAGTFHYYCEVHGSPNGGMDAKVRVPVWIQTTGVPDVVSITWAEATKTGKVFDVQYRVDGGDWVTWKTDTAKLASRFGKNDQPVPVEPGHTYDLRARSQKRADTPAKVSGWSPPQSFGLFA